MLRSLAVELRHSQSSRTPYTTLLALWKTCRPWIARRAVQELVQNIVCRRVDKIAGARHPSRPVGITHQNGDDPSRAHSTTCRRRDRGRSARRFGSRPGRRGLQSGRGRRRPRDVSARVSGRVHGQMADVGTRSSPARSSPAGEPAARGGAGGRRGGARDRAADLDRINDTRPQAIAARRAELAEADAEVTLAGEPMRGRSSS